MIIRFLGPNAPMQPHNYTNAEWHIIHIAIETPEAGWQGWLMLTQILADLKTKICSIKWPSTICTLQIFRTSDVSATLNLDNSAPNHLGWKS